MKFTLKSYQNAATQEVLKTLERARDGWHGKYRQRSSFALSSTTGSGKTVIAAAVFEALFHGNDDYDVEADPGAVVIWFSDNPSLNEQTKNRLQEASDKLNPSDMVVVDKNFIGATLQAGKIYFLNTQKLGKKSLLVRDQSTDEPDSTDGQTYCLSRPDARGHTMWDIIRNTIEDEDLTLYLVVDEAHRGVGKPKKGDAAERETILLRLINGKGSTPAVPVVWGISATIERFEAAMKASTSRDRLSNVEVDSREVQASGLLKDKIILDIPDEVSSAFDTTLVRRATDKLIESSQAWRNYAEGEGEKVPVKPLMVLQVPNKPNHDEIGEMLDAICDRWPEELQSLSFAHVFGEHTAQTFGGHTVAYIPPQGVHDAKYVRVLIAKDAISTGWDCPRAEVMVSLRGGGDDETHVTQLLGRMIRTPLARRIPGNDRLNSVDCLLPRFNKKTVGKVVNRLMNGDDGQSPLPGREVLINPESMYPNRCIGEEVWTKFVDLPSQRLPGRGLKPIKRLMQLAHELAFDGLLKDAGKLAESEMHKSLDAAKVQYVDEIKKARIEVNDVDLLEGILDLKSGKISFQSITEVADQKVLDEAFRKAARALSPALSDTYTEYLVQQSESADDKVEALILARTEFAVLGLVPEIMDYIDRQADALVDKWYDQYRFERSNLSDERQEVYREIKRSSDKPQDVDIQKPDDWVVRTHLYKPDGTEVALPRYDLHLMADQEGKFPVQHNDWEDHVLQQEMGRDGFTAWYRNPSTASTESLGVAYEQDGRFKIVRPDFVFFSSKSDGSLVADIVDPHSDHLADALPKIQGLAVYAEQHGEHYRRIESVAKTGAQFRVLDLKNPDVRAQIDSATSAASLYESAGSAYP